MAYPKELVEKLVTLKAELQAKHDAILKNIDTHLEGKGLKALLGNIETLLRHNTTSKADADIRWVCMQTVGSIAEECDNKPNLKLTIIPGPAIYLVGLIWRYGILEPGFHARAARIFERAYKHWQYMPAKEMYFLCSDDHRIKLELLKDEISEQQRKILETSIKEMKDEQEFFCQAEDTVVLSDCLDALSKSSNALNQTAFDEAQILKQTSFKNLNEYYKTRKSRPIVYMMGLLHYYGFDIIEPDFKIAAAFFEQSFEKHHYAPAEAMQDWCYSPFYRGNPKKLSWYWTICSWGTLLNRGPAMFPSRSNSMEKEKKEIQDRRTDRGKQKAFEQPILKLQKEKDKDAKEKVANLLKDKKTAPYELRFHLQSLLHKNLVSKILNPKLKEIIYLLLAKTDDEVASGVNQLEEYCNDASDVVALHIWGMICQYGVVVAKNYPVAALCYKIAAEREYAAAMTSQALLGEERGFSSFISNYLVYWEAAERGCERAAFKIAEFLFDTNKGNNQELGVTFALKSALKGYMPALSLQAHFLRKGSEDSSVGSFLEFRMLKFAAALKYPPAMRELSTHYHHPKSINLSLTEMLFIPNVDRLPEDFRILAKFYGEGLGAVKQPQPDTAAELKEQAQVLELQLREAAYVSPVIASQNEAIKLLIEGQKFKTGAGVAKNYLQAVSLFSKASCYKAAKNLAETLLQDTVKHLFPSDQASISTSMVTKEEFKPLEDKALKQFILLKEEIIYSIFLSLRSTDDIEYFEDFFVLIDKLLMARNEQEKAESLKELKEFCVREYLKGEIVARATYYLGLCAFYGLVKARDLKLGLTVITRAASLGYSLAHNFLGEFHSQQLGEKIEGIETDIKKATEFFYKISKCSTVGAINFALSLEAGLGICQDPNMARKILEHEARWGSPLAKAHLAKYYALGQGGVHRDLFHAKRLNRAAYRGGILWARDQELEFEKSEHNNPNRIISAKNLPYKVKRILEQLRRNFREHSKLLSIINELLKSSKLCPVFNSLEKFSIDEASFTDRDALALLGFCHQHGIGTEAEQEAATLCYLIAEDHPLSCYGLAEINEKQNKNSNIAVDVLKKLEIASEFIPEALCKLGNHFCNKEDATRASLKIGLQYLQKGCEQLYPEAYTNLGFYYLNAGTIQNAILNFEIAAKLGSPTAKYEQIKLHIEHVGKDIRSIAPEMMKILIELAQEYPDMIEPDHYTLLEKYATSRRDLAKMVEYHERGALAKSKAPKGGAKDLRVPSEEALKSSCTHTPCKEHPEHLEYHLKHGQDHEETGTKQNSSHNYFGALCNYYIAMQQSDATPNAIQDQAKHLFEALLKKLQKRSENSTVIRKTLDLPDQSYGDLAETRERKASTESFDRKNENKKEKDKDKEKDLKRNPNKERLYRIFKTIAEKIQSEALISEKPTVLTGKLQALVDHLDTLHAIFDQERKIVKLQLNETEITLDKEKVRKLIIKLFELQKSDGNFYSNRGKKRINDALQELVAKTISPESEVSKTSAERAVPSASLSIDKSENEPITKEEPEKEVQDSEPHEEGLTFVVRGKVEKLAASLRLLSETNAKLSASKSEIITCIKKIKDLAASEKIEYIKKKVSEIAVSNPAHVTLKSKFIGTLENDKKRAEDLEQEFANILDKLQTRFDEFSKKEGQYRDEFKPLNEDPALQTTASNKEIKEKLAVLLLQIEEANSKAKNFLKEVEKIPIQLEENADSLAAIKKRVDERSGNFAPRLSLSLDFSSDESGVIASVDPSRGRSGSSARADADSASSSDSESAEDKEESEQKNKAEDKESFDTAPRKDRLHGGREKRREHHQQQVAAAQEAKRLREKAETNTVTFMSPLHLRNATKLRKPKDITLADKSQAFEKTKIREETPVLEKIIKSSAFKANGSKSPARLLAERNAFLGCCGRILEIWKLFFPVESEVFKHINHVRNVIFHSQKYIPLLCKFDKKTLDEDLAINEKICQIAIDLFSYLYQVMNFSESDLNDITLDTLKQEISSPLFHQILEHEIPAFELKAAKEQIDIGQDEIDCCLKELDAELRNMKSIDCTNLFEMYQMAIGFSETRIATSASEISKKANRYYEQHLIDRKIHGESIPTIITRSAEFRHIVPLEVGKDKSRPQLQSQSQPRAKKSALGKKFY